jgi:hypothetical protein
MFQLSGFHKNQVCNHHSICVQKSCIKYYLLISSISASITHFNVMSFFGKYVHCVHNVHISYLGDNT